MKFELDSKEFSLSVSLLYEALKQGAGNVNSKNDFSNLVWLALLDVITLASLSDNLKVLNKVSLSSSLQADFLILQGQAGFPVGVIEVKKPDTSTDPMKETRMFGELFDYMMFLKSTYNLTQIFGVLTVVGEVMKERRRREREVDNLSTCGCVIQLYLWENTRFIEIREFGWGFLMLTS